QAAVFEATFQYALTDADGLIIEEGVAMSSTGVGWGGFDFTIDYSVDRSQRGALIVWTDSARDGSRTDVREYPVFLERWPLRPGRWRDAAGTRPRARRRESPQTGPASPPGPARRAPISTRPPRGDVRAQTGSRPRRR